MSVQPYPDWMKPALDQRFNELAVMARQLDEVHNIRQEQNELTEKLKSEFTVAQFKLILELLDLANYRNAVEKQYMYLDGLKDGMKIGDIPFKLERNIAFLFILLF